MNENTTYERKNIRWMKTTEKKTYTNEKNRWTKDKKWMKTKTTAKQHMSEKNRWTTNNIWMKKKTESENKNIWKKTYEQKKQMKKNSRCLTTKR